jgi:citrate synthase
MVAAPLIIALFVLPFFAERFEQRLPRTADAKLAEHVIVYRYGPAVEMLLHTRQQPDEPSVPINIDGAIAAVCSDLGMPPTVANALFIISRVPGIAAQAQEEISREHPMRRIDPKDYLYDGPSERRLPERRK